MQASELVRIIEAAYRIDGRPAAWLHRMVTALRPQLDAGLGVAGYFVDTLGPGHFEATGFTGVGAMGSADGQARFAAWDRLAPADIKRHVHLFGPGGTGRSIPRLADDPDFAARTAAAHGYADMRGVNAVDGAGHGCAFAAAAPPASRPGLPFGRRAVLDRVAAHLAAAARLVRDADRRVEAVLSPAGKVDHAEGPATAARARDALRAAAVGIDRLRAGRQRLSPEEVADVWQALVAGRWSLVESFERDGRRYYVAHANAPAVPAAPSLSEREAQVVAAVALGRSNQAVAYELGLSPSSVATHLRRAQAKLGVTSRVELILAAARSGR